MKNFAQVVSVALATSVASMASAITIDDFSLDQVSSSQQFVASPAVGSSIGSGPNIIGMEREIVTVRTDGAPATQTRVFAGDNFAGGEYLHAQDPGSRGYSIVIWDGAGENNAGLDFGLGGVDLTANQQVGLEFNLSDSDDLNRLGPSGGAPVRMRLYVYTSASQYSVITIPATAGDGNERLFYGDFLTGTGSMLGNGSNTPFLPSAAAMSPAEFTNVNAIALIVDGSTFRGADVGFDLLRTFGVQQIPMFGSLLMMFAGLAGLRLRQVVARKAAA